MTIIHFNTQFTELTGDLDIRLLPPPFMPHLDKHHHELTDFWNLKTLELWIWHMFPDHSPVEILMNHTNLTARVLNIPTQRAQSLWNDYQDNPLEILPLARDSEQHIDVLVLLSGSDPSDLITEYSEQSQTRGRTLLLNFTQHKFTDIR